MRCAYGLDIGGTALKLGIVSNTGEIIFKSSIRFRSKSVKDVIETLQYGVELLDKKTPKKPIGLGVGLPGCIDRDNLTLTGGADNIPCLNGIKIDKIFSSFKYPLYIDNDANCAAIAENAFGAAQNYDHCAILTIGTGIGCGLILNGKLYRGSHNYAGEPGHITVVPNGIRCQCGNRGCLECYVSAKAIVQHAENFIKLNEKTELKKLDEIEAHHVFELAEQGDEVSKYIIEECARYLGHGLSYIVNLLNPQAIIIGGGLSHYFDHYIKITKTYLRRNTLSNSVKDLQIIPAYFKNEAGIIGAASLVYENHK